MSIVFHHVIFRALLRWGAALAFCLPLKHRPGFRLRALGMLLPLMGLTYVLDPSAQSTNLHELQFSLLALCGDRQKECPLLRGVEPAHLPDGL